METNKDVVTEVQVVPDGCRGRGMYGWASQGQRGPEGSDHPEMVTWRSLGIAWSGAERDELGPVKLAEMVITKMQHA